jgi:hypothetical protein
MIARSAAFGTEVSALPPVGDGDERPDNAVQLRKSKSEQL